MSRRRCWYGCLAAALTAVVLAEAGGCAQLAATIGYLVVGTDAPAEFDGLKGKKVVVVCRPLAGLEYRDTVAAKEVATQVSLLLKQQVSKIKVVDQQKVAAWTDENTWEVYPDVGKALDADMVVAIDLTAFSTYQGPTLYQGKARASIEVFDLKDGDKSVYQKTMDEIVYPPSVGCPISQKSEADFRREFTKVVATLIARNFFPYDPDDDVAVDARALLH
jgi:hypothetical protein